MSIWIAALLAVAAITVTYFTRIRPMRRGAGHCGMVGGPGRDAELGRQIAQLRGELRMLPARDSLDSGLVPSSKPMPPTDA